MKQTSDWREQIDLLDRKIVALLNRRAENVLGLAPLKRRQSLPVIDPARELDVVANVVSTNQGPLSDLALERIFRAVMREMRAVQREPVE